MNRLLPAQINFPVPVQYGDSLRSTKAFHCQSVASGSKTQHPADFGQHLLKAGRQLSLK